MSDECKLASSGGKCLSSLKALPLREVSGWGMLVSGRLSDPVQKAVSECLICDVCLQGLLGGKQGRGILINVMSVAFCNFVIRSSNSFRQG